MSALARVTVSGRVERVIGDRGLMPRDGGGVSGQLPADQAGVQLLDCNSHRVMPFVNQ